MTLTDVWTPIRTTIASEIVTTYNTVTGLTLTSTEGTAIEAMLYNYCHALMDCDMAFSDEATLSELQTILKGVFNHKLYGLVTEWKTLVAAMTSGAGKTIHQESFYDVADTPRIETKDYNDIDVANRVVESLQMNSRAIKDFYNEIKQLVITIYI